MTQPAPIQLDLDPSGYVDGLGRAQTATESFQNNLRTTVATVAPLGAALALATPSRASLAGLTGLAYLAAQSQQAMSGLAAQSKITGANFGTLTSGMRDVARAFPIGNAGAQQLMGTLAQLGAISKGSELNAVSLAKTFSKLGGATGEGPAGLAAGFIALNRSMGTGFSNTMVSKLADSLTTVSAQSGASATGILSFGKSIAPLAAASGIGTTKVLGISAAFAKLGDDGVGAATAFNKMLGDINRGVRDGGPLLGTYANIAGKTTSQFRELFKMNPAEAITQVTEAVAKAGNNGPRLLEQLGLDGPRVQRYLQELSASGGLRSSINQATAGFGSGSTDKASKAAFDNFGDSLIKAKTAGEQFAEALGTPMLGPLKHFADLLGSAASGARAAVASTPAQKIMGLLDNALVPLLIAGKLLGTGLKLLGIGQLAGSGPVRTAVAGYLNETRSGDARFGGFLGRFAGPQIRRMDANEELGTKAMASVNARAGRFGAYIGGFMGRGGTGPGFLRQAVGAAGLGAAGYMTLLSESARLARVPVAEREMSMAMRGPGMEEWNQTYSSLRKDLKEGTITHTQAMASAVEGLKKLSGETGTVSGLFRTTGGAFTSMVTQTGMSLAKIGGSALLRGGMGFLGGPVGATIMAGTVGYQVYQGAMARRAAHDDAVANSVSANDLYSAAMGRSVTALSDPNSAVKADSNLLAQSSSLADARRVTQADVAGSAGRTVVSKYAGGVSAVVAKLKLQAGTRGIDPSMFNTIQQDLLAQGYSVEDVRNISNQLTGPLTPTLGQDSSGDLFATAQGIAKLPVAHSWIPGTRNASLHSSPVFISSMTKASQDQETGLTNSVSERWKLRAGTYSDAFAREQRLKDMDAAVKGALAGGDGVLAQQLITDFQGELGLPKQRIGQGDYNAGGGFTGAEALISKKFRQGSDYATVGTNAAPTILAGSPIQRALAGNPLGYAFSGDPKYAKDPLAAAFAGVIGPNGLPTSGAAQTKGIATALGQAGGTAGLEALDNNAQKLAQSIEDANSPIRNFALQISAAAEASRMFQMAGAGFTPGQQTFSQFNKDLGILSAAPTDANKPEQDAARTRAQGAVQAAREQAQQVVQTVYQSQEAARRSAVEYSQQREYAEKDYGVAISRQVAANELQIFRTERDAQRQRLQALHDFNLARTQQVQDASRAMYDAYTRIHAQSVWDAPNLVGNITEQAQSLQMQITNLHKVRSGGLTNNAIELLGLNDPKNSQQLAQIVADMVNDPKVIKALNSASSQRQGLGETLSQDPANVALARQDAAFKLSTDRAAELLKTNLSDMNVNLGIALNQAAYDHQQAMDRMARANTTMIKNMATDLRNALATFNADDAALLKAANDAAAGGQVNYTNLTGQAFKGWNDTLDLYINKMKKLTDGSSFTISVTSGTNVPNPSPDAGAPTVNNNAPATPGGVPQPRDKFGRTAATYGPGAVGLPAVDPYQHPPPPVEAPVVAPEPDPNAYIPPPYSKPKGLTPAIMRANQADAGSIATQGTAVHYVSSTVIHDNSQTITGVTVVANDPNAMGSALLAQQRLGNLTRAPQAR